MSTEAATVKPFSTIEESRAEYLNAMLQEEVLEPALPIVDVHHHLWDIRGEQAKRYGGRTSRYLVEEFEQEIAASGHNVVATVYVECDAMYRAAGPEEMKPVGEVDFASGMAAMSESGHYGPTRMCAGIVGFADLRLGDAVAPVLEAEIATGGGRFRGIRFRGAMTNDPTVRNHTMAREGLYADQEFRKGVAALGKLGLSLDSMVFYTQLKDLAEMARAIPETTVMIGHTGGPLGSGAFANKMDEVRETWKKSMKELAACENVRVKLGGMTLRLAAYDFRTLKRPPSSPELAALWGPWIGEAIEIFGADRCMFESNFPVEKMGVPFVTIWNAFKIITAGASETEKTALYAGTAREAYRLNF